MLKDLPSEFRTARLESLNEDLQAKAEAIIRKKFKLSDPSKAVTENLKDMLKRATETMQHFTTQVDRPRLRGQVVGVMRHFDRLSISVTYRCNRCGHHMSAEVDERKLDRGSFYECTQVCRCDAYVTLTGDEVTAHLMRERHMYEPRIVRQEYNPIIGIDF